MTIDALTVVLAYAVAYSGINYYLEGPAHVNWTAIAPDTWWGNGDKANQDKGIHAASIVFEDEMIEDLRWRLTHQRPNVKPLEGIAFEYGFNTDQIHNWTTYWAENYDFKAREKDFNKYPMFKTNINGLDIFFVRVTPKTNKEIVPLLLLHGWPGSIKEYWSAIEHLTAIQKDRDFAVEVIVPCLPGFGWSQPAVRPGLGTARMAVLFRDLMKRLGHDKWYVQGTEFGGLISAHMATLYPSEVLGLHTNYAVVLTPFAAILQMIGSLNPSFLVEPALESRMYPLYDIYSNLMNKLGYMHELATKPDTIGIPLIDSPVGLLAFIFEQFASLNKQDGDLWKNYDPNWMIDNLMVYWTTGTATTAARMYAESLNKASFALKLEHIPTQVPTAVIQAVDEQVYQPPPILKTKYSNLVQVSVWDKGGHFVPATHPKEFALDVLKALKVFRKFHKNGHKASPSVNDEI